MKRNTGFTLIELLVVIAIVGLLSSVVLASVNAAREKSRDAKRVREIRELQTALELFYNDNGRYPIGLFESTESIFDWSGSSLESDLSEYIPNLPVDPVNATPYSYFYGSSGTNGECYAISVIVEDLPNPLADLGASVCDCNTMTPIPPSIPNQIYLGTSCP